MRIGVLIHLCKEMDQQFAQLREMDMDNCQLVSWHEEDFTEEMAEIVNRAARAHGVRISAFWCGWGGPVTWDFYEGQNTLGLVPVAYRFQRLQTLLHGCEFAKLIGVRDLVTHVGYLPENPFDPQYQEVLTAVRAIARRCEENGQRFLFETGQETPVTLRRAIEDLGMHNVGVNLDPANLLMYGKANPVDALDVFGEHVMGVHCKDGLYPTDGRRLGEERPLGEGKVNFPQLVAKLEALGYQGDYTIEREISGEEQKKDIRSAKAMLSTLLAKGGALC
ncbi:MAG: sugar phosphate isomerase/epimerase family protein [Clostridia bacterium]